MTQVIPITQNRSKNKSGDFHKQEIRFDIKRLQNACNEVLKIKGAPESLMSAIKVMPESIKIYKGLNVIEKTIKEKFITT